MSVTADWQIHLFVPATSPPPWDDEESAEAWADAHHAWFAAGPLDTRDWFGFRVGEHIADGLAGDLKRWSDETGESDLRSWVADLRQLASKSRGPVADAVYVEPASFLHVSLWSFTADSADAAAEVAASLPHVERSIWEPGTVGYWIDVASAHLLLRVPWGRAGALSVLRTHLWSWLVDRDAGRIGAGDRT